MCNLKLNNFGIDIINNKQKFGKNGTEYIENVIKQA